MRSSWNQVVEIIMCPVKWSANTGRIQLLHSRIIRLYIFVTIIITLVIGFFIIKSQLHINLYHSHYCFIFYLGMRLSTLREVIESTFWNNNYKFFIAISRQSRKPVEKSRHILFHRLRPAGCDRLFRRSWLKQVILSLKIFIAFWDYKSIFIYEKNQIVDSNINSCFWNHYRSSLHK